MAYDASTGQLVLFGGVSGAGGSSEVSYLGDTWLWSLAGWREVVPATSPPARALASIAYDSATGQLVLFGGQSETAGNLDDTWTWDGRTWTQAHPASSPPARSSATIGDDAASGQLVLFGGYTAGVSGSFEIWADTWLWDGITWTMVDPPGSRPSPRSGASAAYDPATRRLVLFGGYQPGSDFDDTWAWDGTGWSVAGSGPGPPNRDHAPMGYDATTGRLVLFGGVEPAGYKPNPVTVGDTWSWDGTAWSQEAPGASPTPRVGASMAWDPDLNRLVIFGGHDGSGERADTWGYSTVAVALSYYTTTSQVEAPPVHAGDEIVLVATIHSTSEPIAPTTTIDFFDGSSFNATVYFSPDWPTSYAIAVIQLSSGTHHIAATYSGEETFRSITTNVLTVVVTN